MKNLKNKKGFTLVELLAVIVVLAIVMGLAVVAITGVLDNARKATFAADAKSFIEGAHALVRSDEVNSLMGETADYAPACTGAVGTTNSVYIPVGIIKLDQGGVKSPYGNNYLKGGSEPGNAAPKDSSNVTQSFILVQSTVGENDCTYTYSIYLTDGVYAVRDGSKGTPLLETSIASSSVGLDN